MITINVLSEQECQKIQKELLTTLSGLYHLEDLMDYEQEVISNCINLLQEIKICKKEGNK